MHLSGKPFQIGGKPVHLIGKPGGGQIGVIQGQGGVMSALNIVTQVSTELYCFGGLVLFFFFYLEAEGLFPAVRIFPNLFSRAGNFLNASD